MLRLLHQGTIIVRNTVKTQNRLPTLLLITLACALLLGACSSQPDNFVIIVMPSSGAFLSVQQETQIISQVVAKRGWSRLELYVNGELVRVDSATADTMYSAIVKQPWIPTVEGPVLISVIAVNERERRIAVAEAAVLVGSPSPTAQPSTPTPGFTHTPVPQLSPTQCAPQAALLQDVSIPPGTVLEPGQSFTKTWRVQNTGSCSWKIYVKGGIVTWETQQTDYPRTRPDLPNHEPRGCARGASYSWYLYSANRVKYPLVRSRLLRLWRVGRPARGR